MYLLRVLCIGYGRTEWFELRRENVAQECEVAELESVLRSVRHEGVKLRVVCGCAFNRGV